MKYIIVLGDGMADEPIPSLGGRTPHTGGRYSGYGLARGTWPVRQITYRASRFRAGK